MSQKYINIKNDNNQSSSSRVIIEKWKCNINSFFHIKYF